MVRGYMSNKAADKSCKCDDKNKENWSIVEAHRNSKGDVIATCSCKVCGNWWETKATYIKSIKGSEKYTTLFEKEQEDEIKRAKHRLTQIDEEISKLMKEKIKLEKLIS